MSKIAPGLWFDDRAEEAANFYVATFRACSQDAALGKILRYGAAGPKPAGTVLTVTFTLAGQEFSALNGGPEFTFTPAISLVVKCADQRELQHAACQSSRNGDAAALGDIASASRILRDAADGAPQDEVDHQWHLQIPSS